MNIEGAGAITQRVIRVGRLAPEARSLLRFAARIAKDHAKAEARANRRWVTLCISTYPQALTDLDESVRMLAQSGIRSSRSELIRIALRRLDLAAVIAEHRSDA